ncbi:polyamine ABC transporter substrate-binding protein [Shinella zoogloeoides]|uniref:Extracellular solute-binding protein n=1 Tax=Shinella zoogloeoides TaxID=352475 RepID=A0A6N8T9E3_SHIZO|nr:spermidine/putrescine ABC transporter substrate-binding protein [Shinella zoogloeoides]MXN99588.1 extracellular solute-binding protein [Shinella zoogloeoides]UEX82638.1 spermidine/putrescine ABC transporter substrate-binding protein [Shinella zoogloeoides]
MHGAFLAAVSSTAFAVAAPAGAATLNLLIWEAYIDERILKDFTAETGIEVRQTFYDSGDARDEILADPNSNVDVVVTNENGAKLYGNRGVIMAIDMENVPALADYAESWAKRCGGYGVPYLWGTMGILYRPDKITTPPTSWADMMKPAESLRGHIAMYDDYAEAFVAPLALLGKSVNANDNETLKAAYELMKAQAPYVLTYDYVITSIQSADKGPNIYMALGYSGDQYTLNDKVGTPGLWRYVVPKEGTLSWLDCIAVNARSGNKDIALQLVDYISNARNGARNAEKLNMPTASTAAMALLPRDIQSNPEIYAAPEILAKSQLQEELTVQSVQARRRIISSLAQFSDAR